MAAAASAPTRAFMYFVIGLFLVVVGAFTAVTTTGVQRPARSPARSAATPSACCAPGVGAKTREGMGVKRHDQSEAP